MPHLIISTQYFKCMRTSNVDQMIAKHALQTWFSSSPRPRSSLHLYNIYDHRWMPFSYEPDDLQEKFSICMKKSENDSLIEGVENLMKMMNRNRGLDQNEACAPPPSSINHPRTIIVECHFRTDLMTCKENFPSVWKNPKTVPRVMIWMIDFHQVLDPRFTILTKSPISWSTILTKSPTPPSSGDRFRIFSYRWKIFLACHQMNAKSTLDDDRRYYREWCDDRDRELDENQSFRSSLERSFSDFFIQMKKFSCMSSGSCENDTQRWSYENDLSRERDAQTSFWSSSRPRFIIFIKSSTPSIKRSFSDFFIQMENFPCKSSGSYENDIQRWS
jgi:hypothetical protein